MRKMRWITSSHCVGALVGGMILIVGCAGDSSLEEPTAEPTVVSSPPAAPPPAAPPMGTSTTAVSQTDDAPAAEEQESQEVKAETGVGKKGRGYGGGVISEPVRAYFRTRQTISFLQLDRGMREFKAINERAPESHEEFMEKIVKEYGVELPELPAGQSYFYDPDREELMVRKPAN